MTDQMLGSLTLPRAFFEARPLVTGDGYALTTEDRLQMMESIHRFEWSYGALDQDAVFDLLTDDVVMDHGMGYARGKSELAALGVPSYGLRHMFSNHVLFIDEQGAPNIVAHMLVIQVQSEEPPAVPLPAILDQGVNRYRFRREDGRWKICTMIFEQQKLADHAGAPEAVQRSMAQTEAERAREHGRV